MEEVKKVENPRDYKRIAMALGGVVVGLIFGIGYSVFITRTQDVEEPEVAVVQEEAPVSTIGGEIAFVEGTVEYKDNGALEWSIADPGVPVMEGSVIRIRQNGRAIVNLDDGSAVRINSRSQVTFSSMDSRNIMITNDQGEIYTRVAKLDRLFTVNTDNAEYLSLGTAFKTINSDASEGVVVYESKVEVNGDKVVEEGQSVYVKTDGEIEENVIIELEKDKLLEDEFVEWNKKQDELLGEELGFLGEEEKEEPKDEPEDEVEEKKPEPKVEEPVVKEEPKAPVNPASISLSSVSSSKSGQFTVKWSTSNLDASKGFKVVYNKSGSPKYGVDKSSYISSSSQTSASVSNLEGGTYYVRVCKYTGSGCENYSNEKSVVVESKPEIVKVDSISLSYDGSNKLTWQTGNGSIGHGFKVVLNSDGSPTYPENSIQYTESQSKEISESGYYRICAWNGSGGCDAYSNEIHVTNFGE